MSTSDERLNEGRLNEERLREMELLAARVAKLREAGGELDDAAGTQLIQTCVALLTELRAERERSTGLERDVGGLAGKRWLVVYVDPDATGAGQDGKQASVTFHRVSSEEVADALVRYIDAVELGSAQHWGGYPGYAYALDLDDPDALNDGSGWWEDRLADDLEDGGWDNLSEDGRILAREFLGDAEERGETRS